MKILRFAIYFLLILMYACTNFNNDRKPTKIREQKNEADKEAFNEWYEAMHKAATGVNWRDIEDQNRFKQYQAIVREKQMRAAGSEEILANGLLKGFWKERGSVNQSGRVLVAELDHQNLDIYVAAQGGQIFKGTIEGNDWEVLNDHYKFSSVVMLRIIEKMGGGKRILVADENKKFAYSDDFGLTWNLAQGLSNLAQWGNIKRSFVVNDSAKTIVLLVKEWDYGATNQAIMSLYFSTDLGENFQRIQKYSISSLGDQNHWDLWVPYYENKGYYVVNRGSILHQDSFYSIPPQVITQYQPISQGTTMLTGRINAQNTELYVFNNEKLYTSKDNGLTWRNLTDLQESPFTQLSFSSALSDSNKLYFGSVEMFRYVNTIQYWQKVNPWGDYYGNPKHRLHADIPGVFSFWLPNQQEITLICTDGGLYKSYNQAETVENISLKGLNCSQYYSVYTHKTNPNHIYAGSQDQGFQRTNVDSGGVLGFKQVISGDYGHIVSNNDGESIWMVYPGFADFYENARIGNGGAWWDFTNSIHFWMPPLKEHPGLHNVVYLAGGRISGSPGSYILKLTDQGNGVTAEQLPFNFSANGGGNIAAIDWHLQDENRMYVLTDNGRFYYSTNEGQTFTRTSGFTAMASHYFYGSSIYASKLNNNVVYIGGSGYSNAGAYKSVDGGLTFTAITNGLPPTLIFQLEANDSETLIFAATEAGPFVYVVSLNEWFPMFGTKAPQQTYWTVDYIKEINTVRFGTYGRGIWDFEITDQPVNTSLAPIAQLTSFNVFPNPTTQNIQITSSSSDGYFQIFNLTGKLIESGNYHKNTVNVSALKSGTYLLRIGNNIKKFVKL
jgi:hypothetical protein